MKMRICWHPRLPLALSFAAWLAACAVEGTDDPTNIGGPRGGSGGAVAGGAPNGGSTPATGGQATGGTAGTTSGSGGTGGATGGGTGGQLATGGAAAGGIVFQADFEGAGPNLPAGWTPRLVGSSGTVQVAGGTAHGGKNALHVKHTGFSTYAAIEGAPVFPAPRNQIAGRVWLRLAGPMPSGHVSWVEAGRQKNDESEVRIGANLGQLDINHWPGDEEQRAPGVTLQANTWHCLRFSFDGEAHRAQVWLDERALTELTVTNWVAPKPENGNNTTPKPNWAPTFEALRFGWELGQGEVWFDDVAIVHGVTPPPCE